MENSDSECENAGRYSRFAAERKVTFHGNGRTHPRSRAPSRRHDRSGSGGRPASERRSSSRTGGHRGHCDSRGRSRQRQSERRGRNYDFRRRSSQRADREPAELRSVRIERSRSPLKHRAAGQGPSDQVQEVRTITVQPGKGPRSSINTGAKECPVCGDRMGNLRRHLVTQHLPWFF